LYWTGLYCALFGTCVYILSHREGVKNTKLYLGWTIILFILSTGLVVDDAWIVINRAITAYKAVQLTLDEQTAMVEIQDTLTTVLQ
jgi:hypothetical protein